MNDDLKISFLGGGNMASALVGGLIQRGFNAKAIQAVEPAELARKRLGEAFGIHAAAQPDVSSLSCDVLVLAVKPQQMKAALAPISGKLGRDTVVISVAAGLRLADLSRWLGGHEKLIRAMPNTPALIGCGVTGLFAHPSVSAAGRAAAEAVLSAVGSVVWVDDEVQIDAITAVSGSGPAYVFHFIEALEAAACTLGFDQATARQLAVDTVFGAARLAVESSEPPAVLRERVTSPGGTTAAALASLAESGFIEIVERAVRAAEARGRELGDALGKD